MSDKHKVKGDINEKIYKNSVLFVRYSTFI